jgi:hypothetical protein
MWRLLFVSFLAWFSIYRSCSCRSRVDFTAPDLGFPCRCAMRRSIFSALDLLRFLFPGLRSSLCEEPSSAGLVSISFGLSVAGQIIIFFLLAEFTLTLISTRELSSCSCKSVHQNRISSCPISVLSCALCWSSFSCSLDKGAGQFLGICVICFPWLCFLAVDSSDCRSCITSSAQRQEFVFRSYLRLSSVSFRWCCGVCFPRGCSGFTRLLPLESCCQACCC